jgi:cytochrome bd ubiquinol oxidase subunit I
MDALTLARLQFGSTTLYHFLFVPLSIGLVFLVAVLQTLWVVRGRDEYLRLTRFFGHLYLITFAMGVATGLVQEFQFGMNWSQFSRFVGDVFGAPLALEGLLAFFLESTFLGLWVFGWRRLPRLAHLACIWIVVWGSTLSAMFILVANSWMQHPVGYRVDPVTGRAQLTDIAAVVTNPTLLVTIPHVLSAGLLTGAMFVLAISAYHLRRRHHAPAFQKAAVVALVVGLVAALGVVVSGDAQGQLLERTQPAKLAASESLWATEQGASLSVIQIGGWDGRPPLVEIAIPRGLSLLATHTWDAQLQGLRDLQARDQVTYGSGDYLPSVPVSYVSFRVMVGLGTLLAGFCVLGLVLLWRDRLGRSRWFQRAALLAVFAPLAANSAGWVLREMGRQPWTVYGVLTTGQSVSPSVPAGMVGATLAGFALVYGALAVVTGWLLARSAAAGLADEEQESEPELTALLAY